MNISKENVDELNAVVTLTVDKADYEPKVEESLKNYRKKVSMPGFRPGHVPANLVKKMYGKQILAEEVNRLFSTSLNNYIVENKIDIVGEPLPHEGQEPIDFDKEIDTINFKFDLGLKPALDIEINDKIKLPAYTIDVTDETVDKLLHDQLSRLSTSQKVDVVSEKSFVEAEIEQEGGAKNENGFIGINNLKGEQDKFIGAKAGDVVKFDIRKAYEDDNSFIAYALGISAEDAANVKGEATATIKSISEQKEPELNQELFDKLLGEGKASNEEEFKARIREHAAKLNSLEEDYRFTLDLRDALLKNYKVELPEAFLRRWITLVNADNKEFTPEVLDKEFPKFIEDLKWQVVKNAVLKKNDIKITEEDIVNFAKNSTVAQFAQYGIMNIPEDKLDEYAKNQVRSNKEQYEHYVEGASNYVISKFAKEHAKIESKAISHQDFAKLFENK